MASSDPKILVVTGELDTRLFLLKILNMAGWRTASARGGAEALRAARSIKPALIILDIIMADEGGIQLYRRLKGDRVLKKIPVILLSTIDKDTFYFYEKSQKTLSGAGRRAPEAYLQKPPEAEELLGKIHQLMQVHCVEPL